MTTTRRRRSRRDRRHTKRILYTTLAALLLVAALFEGYRFVSFYSDATAARAGLLSLRDELDLAKLETSETGLLATRTEVERAQARAHAAHDFARNDPLISIASHLPILGKQAKGVRVLTETARDASDTAIAASDVAIAFSRQGDTTGDQTSVQHALAFLKAQEAPMALVEQGLVRLQADRDRLPDGLIGPLANASGDLDGALARLEGLVSGYSRADALLPQLLGYEGPKTYLILPQNDTELFPSGGLISSYAIAYFDEGGLDRVDLEYFGALYDRWQSQTGGEYIEPPAPLKQYLKKDFSWGLGEAGWYPDFTRTAQLARSFVEKGGAPPTDGTIAIDLHFVGALLELLGPLEMPGYKVTITPQNLREVTLENTRDDAYVPGEEHQAFLSYLAQATLDKLFTAPKGKWVDLLKLLDQQARERHLQLNFQDPKLQSLSAEYGLDGTLAGGDTGDYLMLADTSVNSTKLNLILKNNVALDVQLTKDGAAQSHVTYSIQNPVREWAANRDEDLVRALMLQGVYGCYLRVYAPKQAQLVDVRVNGKVAGAEQINPEFGRMSFGRFFRVLPDETGTAEIVYYTAGVIEASGDLRHYRLYVQKEAGTGAIPFDVDIRLPAGAKLVSARLDGEDYVGALHFQTDLRTDRVIEVTYTP
ncbi:MAG TPA: DUF4012 domain-containing protein [Dehalococcoidia bacterium]|nr:DUF4012 domain-containing protein [Dehalococcoidia bacterium]